VTRLEDRLRRAIHAKAEQVPYDVVPPLRLPVRRRRSFSLAYGGGERTGASAARRWFAPAASAALVAAVIAGSLAVSRFVPGQRAPGQQGAAATFGPGLAATRNEAAAWVATEVSATAVVSCDPVMCGALRAYGVPGSKLLALGPGATDPLRSQVIVATEAVRTEFGSRLSSVYAPGAIASFGTGSRRIEVRVVAPRGAAAYRSALRADIAARRTAGTALLSSTQVTASAPARRQLLAGQVDARLLIVITTMASQNPIFVEAFGDAGPGASAGSPLRSADLAGTASPQGSDRSAVLRQMIDFLSAQQPPYRPARAVIARLPSGQAVVSVEFAAPSPLGLIAPGGGE